MDSSIKIESEMYESIDVNLNGRHASVVYLVCSRVVKKTRNKPEGF